MLSKRVVLLLVLLAAAALAACSREEESIPTLVPTAAPPDIPTEEPQVPPTNTPEPEPDTGDTVWERIQESGVMRVGTSGDYPPFEFYNDEFQLDGLDIAIIKDIAKRLDLEVEISDFAFDGLGDALTIGQIDVAIAAITVTPQRAGALSFSNVYFLSEEATLTLEDSTVEISVLEDLADFRIGVQSGTVYEDWVEENLVETGRMAQRKVHVYADTSDMLADLDAGFVDVLLIDKQPAETAAESGPYIIASSGMQRQLFAIAMPRGAATLVANVNRALLAMQSDGTLYDLIELYVGIPEEEVPEFPPIDEIEPIPPEEPDCINGLRHVADLSFDDQNFNNIQQVPAGIPYQKGWRLENSGTCEWMPSYAMVYVGGNSPLSRMGGQKTAIGTTVVPGQQYDMWIDLVSPAYPGTYVGYWQMIDDQGVAFGQRVWVAITVPSSATPTPLPTQTPSPGIQFSASPEQIQQGQCSTLAWETSNVKEVYVYPQGENWQNYGVPGTGQQTVCPSTTTTYEMRVVKLDNSVEIRNVTVNVTPNPPGAPIITRFTAEPKNIFVGQCVTVQWIVEGQVDRVILSRNTTVLKDPAPISGSLVDCPPVGGQTYLLQATGPGGSASHTTYVTVSESATPPPTATPTVPAPDPPIVAYFDANPKQIEINQCTTLSWGAGGGTTVVQIKRDSNVILDQAPFEGTLVDCPTATATYIYGIVARNSVGATDSATQDVTVSDSKPDNPLLGTSWTLAAIGQGVIPPQISITLSFSSESQLNGFGGCNSYSAGYQVNGTNLSISGFSSTQVLCGEEIDGVESLYLSTLQGATSYQVESSTLTIASSTGDPLQYNAN